MWSEEKEERREKRNKKAGKGRLYGKLKKGANGKAVFSEPLLTTFNGHSAN